jgi:NADH-quinone oxidoreductase subunit A
MPYESGMDPVGDARGRFDIRYYLVAIVFLIFDVELLFLYPWAVADLSNKTAAFGEILVFIVMLGLAYAYAWRKGVFDWSS